MSNTTKSSLVPKPCQENWLEMNPEEKSRFCTLCQKNVFDYDNEKAINTDEVCLRYATSLQNTTKPKSAILTKISKLFIKRK